MRSGTLLSAALLSSGALAAAPLSSTSNQQCFTQYGIVPPWQLVTTNLYTSTTKTATLSIRTTPKTTVTPAAVTSVVTTTSTNTGTITAPTTTDTYTTSKTVTQTSTEIDTSSFTQTVTTTSISTISSTTTIAPPIGFTGLAQWPGYLPKNRRDAGVDARAASSAAASNFVLPTIAPANHQARAAKAASSAKSQYPWAVTCTHSVTFFSTKTTTITAPTSTLTLAVPTSWSTQTSSATRTVTVTPADATYFSTITSIVSTTSTTVTSTTSTSTQTNTVFAPSATFLAQCDPAANQISSAVGQKIGTVSYNPSFILQSLYTKDQTGYGCCAQCALTDSCAGFAQAPLSAGGACYYLTTDGRCDSQQSFGDAFHYYNTNGNGYTVGNGQCGFLSPVAGVPKTG